MTEGLAFGFDDGEDCDETTEEDLLFLKDPQANYTTSEMITQFFNDVLVNNPDYFHQCVKQLLKEDVMLLKQHINFTN